MAKPDPDISRKPANAFEAFVQRIAAVPKAKIDALEAAERAKKPRAKRNPKPKGATS